MKVQVGVDCFGIGFNENLFLFTVDRLFDQWLKKQKGVHYPDYFFTAELCE